MANVCVACGGTLAGQERFCPHCAVRTETLCPSCDEMAPLGAKFCPSCGVSLKGTPPVTRVLEPVQSDEVPPPPASGVAIEFAASTSASFEFALREAALFPSFAQYGEGKKAVYRVTFEASQLASALGLIEHMKGWRRRAVYVDGEKLPWDTVFTWVRCFEDRKAAYRPEFYCFGHDQGWAFNLCGCMSAGIHFRERAPWTQWGRFVDKNGDWAFDKVRILHEAEKNLFRVRLCPALDLAFVHRVIMALPDRVNPKKDRDWQFVRGWGEGVEGLVMVTREHGFEQKVVMVGVESAASSSEEQPS